MLMQEHKEGIGFLGATLICIAFDLALVALWIAVRR
jgi:hypothetical protein